MKDTAKTVAGAALAAVCFAGMATAQAQTIAVRSSYPVEAPVALRVFENSAKCLPGRGEPGADSTAARVEIRAVKGTKGRVPLTENKASDEEANPLVAVTRVGAGVVGERPGRFSVNIPRSALMKVSTNAYLSDTDDGYHGFFARVYDAPTVEEASYYMDSEIAAYQPSQLYTNLVFKQKSMTPIAGDDPDLDSDGDGICDRDEAEIGTDHHNADSDGDGLDDWQELMADLDPLKPLDEELPVPVITSLSRFTTNPAVTAVLDPDSELHVEGDWTATANPRVTYALEFVPDLTIWPENGGDGKPREFPLTTVSSTNWVRDITDLMTNGWGFLRVKRVIAIPEKTVGGQ